MEIHTIILFPYNGFTSRSEREKLFWEIVKCCREVNNNKTPVVVLNRDTEKRQLAKSFLEDKRTLKKEVQILKVWSVDTCQMWLNGWGYIIDHPETKDGDRIV
jgi:hypothetical protein